MYNKNEVLKEFFEFIKNNDIKTIINEFKLARNHKIDEINPTQLKISLCNTIVKEIIMDIRNLEKYFDEEIVKLQNEIKILKDEIKVKEEFDFLERKLIDDMKFVSELCQRNLKIGMELTNETDLIQRDKLLLEHKINRSNIEMLISVQPEILRQMNNNILIKKDQK